MLITFFFLLTLTSWIYWVVACYQVHSFYGGGTGRPGLAFQPPVSILKPVRGVDEDAYANFASFCRQNYPKYEILFGVADAQDPVIPIITKLQEDFPETSIHLHVFKVSGANQKTGLLQNLVQEASYEVLAASDSDMLVTPDYLMRVVAPLADPRVGLVTCPYRGCKPVTLTARLEALHMGVMFMPSAIVANRLFKFPFGLGSTEVFRKSDLASMGGFEKIADYLADDFHLGLQLARSGLRVILSDYIVDNVLGATSFHDQWSRELRWAHCNRVSRPLEYPGLLITYSVPLALMFLLVSYFSTEAWLVLAGTLALRWSAAYLITGYTNDSSSRRWLFWLPVREMLSATIWWAGLVSHRVVWRGSTYILSEDGILTPWSPGYGILRRIPIGLIRYLVVFIDAILRLLCRIFEFSTDEQCILRLSLSTSDRALTLIDGTEIEAGDPVAELHFWNERVPPIPPEGPNLAWALVFQRQVRDSLEELAVYIQDAPKFQHIQGLRGNLPFNIDDHQELLKDIVERWGFEFYEGPIANGAWDQFAHFWERVYEVGLLIAFNPASLHGRHWDQIKHAQIWMSRNTLMRRYLRQDRIVKLEPEMQSQEFSILGFHFRK